MTKHVLSHNFPALDVGVNFSIHHVYESFFAFFEAERAFVERVFLEKLVKLTNRQPLQFSFWRQNRNLLRFPLEIEHICHKITGFGNK